MRIERSKKRRIKRFITLILIGVIFLYVGINFFLGGYFKKHSLTTPAVSPSPKNYASNTLGEVVKSILEGTTGTYGVAIKSLKNNNSYYLNEHKIFDAGSLYKLWVMAEAYEQIQSGSLKEDEVLSEDVATLNDKFYISAENAEQTEGTITLSVADALNRMITISHNYAALLLTERIKLSRVNSFLAANGFSESKVGINGENPITSAFDISLFFEKLYKGELANMEYTNKMLDLLKKQQLNNKLPKYLPPGVVIAHKTGEINFFSHDGGIVYLPSGDYIISILSDSAIPLAAEDRIAQISKGVYGFFNKQI